MGSGKPANGQTEELLRMYENGEIAEDELTKEQHDALMQQYQDQISELTAEIEDTCRPLSAVMDVFPADMEFVRETRKLISETYDML